MLGDTLYRRALLAVLADVGSTAERVGQALSTSVTDSLELLDAEGADDLDDLHERAEALPVAYLSTQPGPMVMAGIELRSQIVGRLRERTCVSGVTEPAVLAGAFRR